jgi:hypothetical protein
VRDSIYELETARCFKPRQNWRRKLSRCIKKVITASQFLFSESLYGDSDTEVEQRREENVDTGKTGVSDQRKDLSGSNGVGETSDGERTTKINILDKSLNVKNPQVTTGDAIKDTKDRHARDLRRCCVACSHTECRTLTKNSIRDGPNYLSL